MRKSYLIMATISIALQILSCSAPPPAQEGSPTPPAPVVDKGIGPITEVALGDLNLTQATQGKKIFDMKCSACHKSSERYVGPALKDVTQRRSPEWIMNMILNPSEMLQQNEVAKELLAEYLTPMTFQNLSSEEARAVLEYFRHADAGIAVETTPSPQEPKGKTPGTKKSSKKKS